MYFAKLFCQDAAAFFIFLIIYIHGRDQHEGNEKVLVTKQKLPVLK
jgi:hypothetical protein